MGRPLENPTGRVTDSKLTGGFGQGVSTANSKPNPQTHDADTNEWASHLQETGWESSDYKSDDHAATQDTNTHGA